MAAGHAANGGQHFARQTAEAGGKRHSMVGGIIGGRRPAGGTCRQTIPPQISVCTGHARHSTHHSPRYPQNDRQQPGLWQQSALEKRKLMR